MIVDKVLQHLPEWTDAAITELGGGLTNRAWKIEKAGRAGVLKIDESRRTAPFHCRRFEAGVQRRAAEAGLAPRVLYADDAVLFTEYVDGTVWSRNSFGENGNLERLAHALRRLHALPLTGRRRDLAVTARQYASKAGPEQRDRADYCIGVIDERCLPQDLRCCHNDLVAENLVATPELLFLDWEYACDNDPVFDLATVVEHHELPEAQIVGLLHAYFGTDVKKRRRQLAVQQRVYRALYWLWMAGRDDIDADVLNASAERLVTIDS